MKNIYEEKFKKFGNNVRKFRKEKKLTQLDLEINTGISNADISRIENGQKNIELITIFKIADALDVSVSCLFK